MADREVGPDAGAGAVLFQPLDTLVRFATNVLTALDSHTLTPVDDGASVDGKKLVKRLEPARGKVHALAGDALREARELQQTQAARNSAIERAGEAFNGVAGAASALLATMAPPTWDTHGPPERRARLGRRELTMQGDYADGGIELRWGEDRAESAAPDLLFLACDDVLRHEHATGTTTLVATGRG